MDIDGFWLGFDRVLVGVLIGFWIGFCLDFDGFRLAIDVFGVFSILCCCV